MADILCLSNIEHDAVPMFVAALKAAGSTAQSIVAPLEVAQIGKLAPRVLICDLDQTEIDPLETLRQLRFVLPACIILVYTLDTKMTWALDCHLAGASGLLSKSSNQAELIFGMRKALQNGCFTDPRLAML